MESEFCEGVKNRQGIWEVGGDGVVGSGSRPLNLGIAHFGGDEFGVLAMWSSGIPGVDPRNRKFLQVQGIACESSDHVNAKGGYKAEPDSEGPRAHV